MFYNRYFKVVNDRHKLTYSNNGLNLSLDETQSTPNLSVSADTPGSTNLSDEEKSPRRLSLQEDSIYRSQTRQLSEIYNQNVIESQSVSDCNERTSSSLNASHSFMNQRRFNRNGDENGIQSNKNISKHSSHSASCTGVSVKDIKEKISTLHSEENVVRKSFQNSRVLSADQISYSDEERLLPPECEVVAIVVPDSPIAQTKSYKKRFWILFVFSLFSFFTCVQWNTWGPISASMIAAFPDWTYGTVAWMESLVTGLCVVSMLPICWATARFGLRMGMLIATSVLAVGLSLRCITDQLPLFTIMCHICSTLLGLSMTLVLAAPPLVASEWFPPNQRTSATALIMGASQLGSVGSFLEPLIVHSPAEGVPNSLIRSDIMFLMYLVAGIGGAFFLVVLLYFPSKPKIPPSQTSSTARLEFRVGFAALLTDKNLMKLILIYGVACGPSLGWVGMLNYSLEPLGYNQDETMFIGLVSVFACFFLSIATGMLTDRLYGYLRETIVCLLIASSLSYYWFLLISHNIIDVIDWQVYTSISLGLALNYCTIPLFYELAAEMSYPAHEMLVGGFVTGADSFFTCIFLLLFMIKNIGFQWVTYVLVGSNAVPVLGLFFVEEGYRKAKLDRSPSEESS